MRSRKVFIPLIVGLLGTSCTPGAVRLNNHYAARDVYRWRIVTVSRTTGVDLDRSTTQALTMSVTQTARPVPSGTRLMIQLHPNALSIDGIDVDTPRELRIEATVDGSGKVDITHAPG
ncbi:MAG TPA: hypothetical protein VI541_03045, partial [Actinomycetota bacterium]|nr:hypothetical protein [Actinomycetota bacterium]